MSALEFRLAETLGGTAKPGWSPRKGRRFESLPRRKPCRNTADQPFLLSINRERVLKLPLFANFCVATEKTDSEQNPDASLFRGGGNSTCSNLQGQGKYHNRTIQVPCGTGKPT